MSTAKRKSAPQFSKAHSDRFNAKVIRNSPDQCWLWTGKTDSKGYGRIMLEGTAYRAHQLAWILESGQLPRENEVVATTCGCAICCNPAHLKVLDKSQHNQNRVARVEVEQPKPLPVAKPKQAKKLNGKPYPEFPLTPHHGSGKWCKKINGRDRYFGSLSDWKAALEEYEQTVDAIRSGKGPAGEIITVDYLVNKCLEDKEGTVSPRTFKDYKNFAPKLKEILGAETDIKKLRSDDFQRMRRKLAEKVSLITLANRIRNAKVFIYHAHKEAMVDAPLPVGTALKNPPKGQMRVAKRARKYVFSIDELHRLYGTASRRMKCFILLGINAALGNKDVGSLRFKDLANDGTKVTLVRGKTGVQRACPLWPETVEALKVVTSRTHKPSDLVFITKFGSSYATEDGSDNPLSKEFAKLCKAANCHVKNRGFYGLRHTFRNIAYRYCNDREAVDFIFGHKEGDTADEHYLDVETQIEDQRLISVSNTVREKVLQIFEPLELTAQKISK